MIIASEYLDRDESRERASSDTTRVAMNYRMFDRDKDPDEQLNLRTRERTNPNARRLAWTINKIDQKDVRESELIQGNEDCQGKQKGINNQLDCDCCCVSLP